MSKIHLELTEDQHRELLNIVHEIADGIAPGSEKVFYKRLETKLAKAKSGPRDISSPYAKDSLYQ